MKVTKNKVLLNEFISKLQKKYTNRVRTNIHVSDLIYCLRQSFFNRTNPKKLNEATLGYFLDGARRHDVLQELSGMEFEKRVNKYGVYGSIDLFNGIPIEFKSTRQSKGVSELYTKQLGYYCTLLGESKGIIVIQRLLAKKNPFEIYDVKYNEDDIYSFTRKIIEGRRFFDYALKNDDVISLSKTEHEWMCINCIYKKECEEVDNID